MGMSHPSERSARPTSSARLRASDDERERVVRRLRDAAAEGRLDLDELESRIEQTLEAKTHAELAALTADLPGAEGPEEVPALVLKGGMFGVSQGPGRWEVPGRIVAHGGTGGVKIDFTRAECSRTEVEVEAYGETSGVVIVIPDSWVADTSGFDPGNGGLTNSTTPDRLPETPLIRLTGSAGIGGGVTIRHPNDRERRKLSSNPTRA